MTAFRNIFFLGIATISLATTFGRNSVTQNVLDLKWEKFKTDYAKSYSSPQLELGCKAIFGNTLKTIESHNKRFDQGEETYSMAINKFADIDPIQFHATHTGAVLDTKLTPHISAPSATFRTPPVTYDARNFSLVTPVRDQGACGSCWAFSALAATESRILLAGGPALDLSEQELVDCFLGSCGGQDQRNAWNWLILNGGSQSEEDYPYTSNNGEASRCKIETGQVMAQVVGYRELDMPTDDATIKRYLLENGPLSVDVLAGVWSQSYSSGVISCHSNQLSYPDHTVLLVGWTKTYWIVKNSWGTGWGIDGYGYVAKGKNKDCGISKWLVAYPLVEY